MAKKIGSLWKRKGSAVIASGVVEVVVGMPTKIVVFKNDRKKAGDKQPDYNIVLSEPQNVKTEKLQMKAEIEGDL